MAQAVRLRPGLQAAQPISVRVSKVQRDKLEGGNQAQGA
jgi:hypothetical protein